MSGDTDRPAKREYGPSPAAWTAYIPLLAIGAAAAVLGILVLAGCFPTYAYYRWFGAFLLLTAGVSFWAAASHIRRMRGPGRFGVTVDGDRLTIWSGAAARDLDISQMSAAAYDDEHDVVQLRCGTERIDLDHLHYFPSRAAAKEFHRLIVEMLGKTAR